MTIEECVNNYMNFVTGRENLFTHDFTPDGEVCVKKISYDHFMIEYMSWQYEKIEMSFPTHFSIMSMFGGGYIDYFIVVWARIYFKNPEILWVKLI